MQACSYSIIILLIPAPVYPIAVDDIKTDQAHISWVLAHNTPEEAAERFILVIKRRQDNATVLKFNLPGTATNYTVGDLTPGNEYTAILIARNSVAEDSSDPVQFSTPSM